MREDILKTIDKRYISVMHDSPPCNNGIVMGVETDSGWRQQNVDIYGLKEKMKEQLGLFSLHTVRMDQDLSVHFENYEIMMGALLDAATDISAFSNTSQDEPVADVEKKDTLEFGTNIIYRKNGCPHRGIIRGVIIVTMEDKFEPTHATPVKEQYLIEYPNGCSSYIDKEDVFLTKEDFVDAMLEDV